MTKAEKMNMINSEICRGIYEAEKCKDETKQNIIKELRSLADMFECVEGRKVMRSDFSSLMSCVDDYENADNELKERRHQQQMFKFLSNED